MEDLHERVANAATKFFKSLPKTGKPNDKEWTVMSAILQLNDDNKLEVVALGTGSKCIGETQMSANGDVLNDSHAEVMCRRGFLRYLYSQLFLAINHKDRIFNFNIETKKFVMKKITFHFYSSQVPCGDAAIIPKTVCRKRKLSNTSEELSSKKVVLNNLPQGGSENTVVENKINNKIGDGLENKINKSNYENVNDEIIGDIFRTGAKCLSEDAKQDPHEEGEMYHVIGVVRTKPGRGIPTLSMSCSDKLAKWLHLGLQGSLLTLILKEPIFISSLTFGSNTVFNKDSLNRALYARLKDISKELFSNIKPIDIKQSSVPFEFYKSDEREQPSPSSIVWCNDKNRPLEVAVEGRRQGVTKKKLLTKSGRLKICKKELFESFVNLISEMELNNFSPISTAEIKNMSYNETKALCTDYQEKWKELKTNGFKFWCKKDPKLQDFKAFDEH